MSRQSPVGADIGPQATPITLPRTQETNTTPETTDEASKSAEDTGNREVLTPEQGSDAIPDGGYGWVIVVCVLASNAVTWGGSIAQGSLSLMLCYSTDS